MSVAQRRVEYQTVHAETPASTRTVDPRFLEDLGPAIEKWSSRRSAALVVTTSLSLWAIMITALTQVARAIF